MQVSALISTIPIDHFFNLIFNTTNSQTHLEWRGVKLLYVLIDEELKGEPETYYFPSSEIILGRVSNIGRYSPFLCPSLKRTLLTIEIPASPGDDIWGMESGRLLDLCLNDLQKVDILKTRPSIVKYFSLSLDKVYPVYKADWKELFFTMYNRLNRIQNLFTIGRKGLFLHCNIDHCIIQGLELANFILNGKQKDKNAWNKKVAGFLRFSARD
jgi:protoporphyrinogen oxidase